MNSSVKALSATSYEEARSRVMVTITGTGSTRILKFEKSFQLFPIWTKSFPGIFSTHDKFHDTCCSFCLNSCPTIILSSPWVVSNAMQLHICEFRYYVFSFEV